MMKEVSPKISVIVPVYNVEKYLHRCVDSILAQTFTDFEVLLIDDGSTDKSGKICDDYGNLDKRVRVFHKANGGVSSARNLGLDNVCGEWVYFVDSDDFLDSNHLQNYAEALNDVDLVYQGYKLVDERTGEVLQRKMMPTCEADSVDSSMDILEKLFKKGNFFGPTWSKIFRVSIIQEHGIRFYESIDLREDEIFTFCFCKYLVKVRVLSTDTYNYQFTPNSLMRRQWIDPILLTRVLTFTEDITGNLHLSTSFLKLINAYLADSWTWCLRMCYVPGHLANYKTRQKIIECFMNAYSKCHTSESKKHFFGNLYLTDWIHLLYYLKRIIL